MNIGKRSFSRVLTSPFQSRHYVAFWNMVQVYPSFFDCLGRYIFGRGSYPYRCRMRTPLGPIAPTLYSYYDLLTVNEIFCRRDYPADDTDRVVVDIGSNIGMSALYFLTRHPSSRAYLYEPDQRNIQRLRMNLADFGSRYTLGEYAVADQEGPVDFGLDEISGRYGGIGLNFGRTIQVGCRHINSVLEDVFKKERFIDILKVDTEGAELKTLMAVKPAYLSRIRKIYLECEPGRPLYPHLFTQSQQGTVCRLTHSA